MPFTINCVAVDHYCCRQRQTMTACFWGSLLSTVWQRRWWSSTAAIGVILDGGGSGIEPMGPMMASSTVAAVDGSGNNGVFTTTYYDDDQHPCPHCPRPRPPLDKEGTAGWRACRDASYLSSPCKSMVASYSCLGVHGACGYHNE
jgi:hypothetical protein